MPGLRSRVRFPMLCLWFLTGSTGQCCRCSHAVMLCYATPCQAVICHTALSWAMACHAVLCCAMLCPAVLCSVVPCHAHPRNKAAHCRLCSPAHALCTPGHSNNRAPLSPLCPHALCLVPRAAHPGGARTRPPAAAGLRGPSLPLPITSHRRCST